MRLLLALVLIAQLIGCSNDPPRDTAPKVARIVQQVAPMPHQDNDYEGYTVIELLDTRWRFTMPRQIGNEGDEFVVWPGQVWGTPRDGWSHESFWPRDPKEPHD